MKNLRSNKMKKNSKSYFEEYEKIMELSDNCLELGVQWEKDGDLFKKITLYDDNYKTVVSFGDTTLIKPII